MITYRDATLSDVPAMAAVQNAIFAAGKRAQGVDESYVKARYVLHPENVQCTVAERDGAVLGFQVLKTATLGNLYGVQAGWGIIGTHIAPQAARQGVGKALFTRTLRAAQTACFPAIDATIGATNAEGLAYYDAMEFETYEILPKAVRKKYAIQGR